MLSQRLGKDWELWQLCKKFVKDNQITCPECVNEDGIYIAAPEFIGEICEIVGYEKVEEL